MRIRLLLRYAFTPVTTLALLATLLLASSPVTAQQAQPDAQIQRTDGSTAQTAGAPWTPTDVINLSQRGGDEISITHSASLTISPGGVACAGPTGAPVYTTQNSYWRVFDLSEFPEVTGGIDVMSVDVGVGSVALNGNDPVNTTVRLYTLDGAFTTANLTEVGSATFTVGTAQASTVSNVPVTGSLSADDVLVVEWDTPSGNPADSGLTDPFDIRMGQNAGGQTGPTYLSAASCGLAEPTDAAAIGFPNQHWVLVVNGVTTEGSGAISIAEARAAGVGATVTVEGVVSRAMGAFAYIQDETAGLTIRQTSGAFFDAIADGTIAEGTELLVTGTLSEFANLLQINEDDLASYSVIGNGAVPDAQEITLEDLVNNGEDYEAELVMVTGLSTGAAGTFAPATSYTVDDGTASDTLRVPNADDTAVDGTDIPAGEFTFTGVVGQFSFDDPSFGYQLLAIEESDIEAGPPPVDEAIHDTGLVQFEVYADGNLGTVSPAPFAGQGFVFDGVNASGNGGLFAATFLVGQSPDQVSGTAYDSGDWVTTSPLVVADPPVDFDQAFEASYDDSGAPLPIGLEVEQFSYSSTEDGRDGFVIIEFDVENTTAGDLEDLYVGIFADWDAGSAVANLGNYDEETSTLYVYDDLGGDTNYYGVTALDDNVSGYNLDAGAGTNPSDEDVYNGMTTFFPIPDEVGDRRTVIGVGPYDIAAGATETVRFAFVGGQDLDGLIANARVAQGGGVDVETSTPEGTFVLDSAYPNPFASATTIGFTLPSAQDVELTVYDVLGRRVATLVDGVRQAGEQTVRFDASSLPSGMYFYRLEAGGTQLTQRVTVIR